MCPRLWDRVSVCQSVGFVFDVYAEFPSAGIRDCFFLLGTLQHFESSQCSVKCQNLWGRMYAEHVLV